MFAGISFSLCFRGGNGGLLSGVIGLCIITKIGLYNLPQFKKNRFSGL